jgi:hypothetical protein
MSITLYYKAHNVYRESEHCLSGTIATGNASMFTLRYLRNARVHVGVDSIVSVSFSAVTYTAHHLLKYPWAG